MSDDTKPVQFPMSSSAYAMLKRRAKYLGLSTGKLVENLLASLELRLKRAYSAAQISETQVSEKSDKLMIEAILIGDLNEPDSKVARTVNRHPVSVRRPEKELRGFQKLELAPGEKQTLIIKTDDNILPLIETDVSGQKLTISHGKHYLRPTVFEVFITVNNLEKVAISGSGNVRGKNRFVAEAFYAEISGSGDMDLEVETDRLETKISGSGSILLGHPERQPDDDGEEHRHEDQRCLFDPLLHSNHKNQKQPQV